MAPHDAYAGHRPLDGPPAVFASEAPLLREFSSQRDVSPRRAGTTRVIVTLRGLRAGPEWQGRIAAASERVLRALRGHRVVVNRRYTMTPALALTVDRAALRILRAHPDVAQVSEDGMSRPGEMSH